MLNVEGFEDDEDEILSTKSGLSVSDFDGDVKQLPPTMYFGNELCRAQFLMTATRDVVHVCGKLVTLCRRPGHRVLSDSGSVGLAGYYDTIRSNSTIDGNAATFTTPDEMAIRLAGQRAHNLAAVETLFGAAGDMEVSPSATAGSWTMASGDAGPVQRFSFQAPLPSVESPTAQARPGNEFSRAPMRPPAVATTVRSPTGLIPDGVEADAAALALERATTRSKIAELTQRPWSLNANEPPPPSHPGPLRATSAGMPTPHPPLPPVQPPMAPPTRFFAAFGLGGRSGVYSNFQMAVSMVGIDSSVVEYTDMDEAMAAVLKWRQHHTSVATQLSSFPTVVAPLVPPEPAAPPEVRAVESTSAAFKPPRSAVPGPRDEGFFPHRSSWVRIQTRRATSSTVWKWARK
jgi:hypothetical protein